jgi:hypothetical protein
MTALSPHVAIEFCKLCDWAYQVWLNHRELFAENPRGAELQQSMAADALLRLSKISHEYTLLQIAKLHDRAVVAGLPLAFVSAHILECILTGYLSRALGSDASIRNDSKLRHNLAGLWSLAAGQGLQLPDPVPSWVECLSGLHNRPCFYLRYSKGVHGVLSPAPEPMASDLPQLLTLVKKAYCSRCTPVSDRADR